MMPSNRSAKVSVIIVNYNSGEYLAQCLEALIAQSFIDFEALVIDNQSTDNSLENLPQDARITIQVLDDNIGFAAANNLGVKQTQAPWVAFLNPDAFPHKDWLQQLMFATVRFESIPMFGSTQINAQHPSLLDGTGDVYHVLGIPYRGQHNHPVSELPATGECFSPCAAAALFKRSVLEEVGGFDERFFCYCEDVDLGFRLRLLGYRAIQLKEASMYHIGSACTGKRSTFQTYHGARNRIWLWVKNMPLPLLLLTFPFFITTQLLLLLRYSIAGHGMTALKGIIDALKGLGPILASRKEIQQKRTVSSYTIAKACTWSMLILWKRQADIRAYNPNPAKKPHGKLPH